MGIARKKSAQKHQLAKAANSSTVGTPPLVPVPARLKAELLSIRSDSTNLLANHIENIKAVEYVVATGTLELRFHLRVIFDDGVILGFRVVRSSLGLDSKELGTLEATMPGSPGMATNYPSISWAANSRFVVNTTLAAPGLVPGDLLLLAAQVGDQLRPIARIYITGIAASIADEASE